MTFYELAGKGARAQLETLADTLREAGVETVLLESQTQPGLFLLVCDTEDAFTVAPPEGSNVWQFRAVS